ncbi:MAG: hypothetical protein MMC33_002791 [Icmadophila ericetorum]|nr:hypothetical protein [Icmadophila ericetorum]
MASSLTGKTAIVTGAGSGINYSFTSSLLSHGCNVLLADLALRPEAQALLSKYSSKPEFNGTDHGASAHAVFLKTDVREWKQLEQMFEVAEKEFGGVDIVCPGAGVFEPSFSSFWYPPGTSESKDAPDSNSYASIEINLIHLIRTTQLAIQHFLSPKRSPPTSPSHPRHVLLISSIAGQVASLIVPLYTATKHAVNGFCRSLGPLDGSVGVRVIGVAPGIVKTPIWLDAPDKMAFLSPEIDQWVEPEDVAAVMTALVSQNEISIPKDSSPQATNTAMKNLKIEGGLIVEVGKKLRVVEPFLDEGPIGREGNTASNEGGGDEVVFGILGKGGWGA